MKLRNKKTGEIADGFVQVVIQNNNKFPNPLEYYTMTTIAELNEKWEDYKPAESLIKDEKVRKAVRAWADVLEIDKVEFYGSETWIGFMAKNAGTGWSSKFELDYLGSENTLIPFRTYTIAELCGEDEE